MCLRNFRFKFLIPAGPLGFEHIVRLRPSSLGHDEPEIVNISVSSEENAMSNDKTLYERLGYVLVGALDNYPAGPLAIFHDETSCVFLKARFGFAVASARWQA